MGSDPLFWVVVAACLAVLVVLGLGIGVFTKGGATNAKYANKLMRLRILLQFIAVLLILIFVIFRQGSGG